MAKTITLISQDDQQFEADLDICLRFGMLKNLLEDLGDSQMPIPLYNVRGNVLKKVLEWCKYHKDDPLNSGEDDMDSKQKKSSEVQDWDQKFMQVDQEMLFEIIMAANYLEINQLLETGCKTVANMIKSKSPEEIRKLFNIENDFTPEEEEQIRKENEWAEDR